MNPKRSGALSLILEQVYVLNLLGHKAVARSLQRIHLITQINIQALLLGYSIYQTS
ncbi:hypothetical protein HanRHA438_Chr10g0469471 [Helianthus annuus]|nr:hypothetical protein HanRHA438_Chr10g0469471 [Helianthus annuus]